MTYLEDNARTGRIILPDLVRAFALIGIALVNVGVIAYPMMGGYSLGGMETIPDKAAFWTVNSFFLLKSYTLFSFMFGVGFAYQIVSAEKRGKSFAGRYFRRILGLLILGLLHVALLFQGDILVMYAILGSLLFLFRKKTADALAVWGRRTFALQVAIGVFFALMMWAGVTYAPEDMALEFAKMEEGNTLAFEVFGAGTYVESIGLRFAQWTEIITFGMAMQGIGALAFFFFGLSAVRSGLINDANHPLWQKYRRIYLPIGIIGSMIGAAVLLGSDDVMSPRMMLGMAIITLFAPFSTAGYLGLIAKWAAGPMTPLKTFMARGGTASLTAYLIQGLLLSFIFNTYGLGLYGQIGALGCTLIALAVALFTISLASLWRTKFQRGPMEVLLRNWTYLGSR